MHVKRIRIKNFRRLQDVTLALDKETSIFVGANNSGKTSASIAVKLFTDGDTKKFSIYDFSSGCWPTIDDFGEGGGSDHAPRISVDLWFDVEESNLHRVVDLLPSLDWRGSLVGLRIELTPIDEAELLDNFFRARDEARAIVPQDSKEDDSFQPSPSTLREYLEENLSSEFEFRYYVLDFERFDESFNEEAGYDPQELPRSGPRRGRRIVRSLLQVDFLNAQRHLSDNELSSRAENLSRRLSGFYERNLERHAQDYKTVKAISDAEKELNKHLGSVFEPLLSRIETLGYPGLSDPRLLVKSSLRPAKLLKEGDSAQLHYALDDTDIRAEDTLPDKYSGLGFKNLIYMVVELLDLHAQWMSSEEDQPPVHLIFIEEPETHLHAQIQQVFIRNVNRLVAVQESDKEQYCSQLVVTTHSPHILYERGFPPIRYFRRKSSGSSQTSEVLNLSEFHERAQEDRDFLQRYLKLTHCDLFFADAAVLVEGNVERLLLPLMIEQAAPDLHKKYLSILEIGGAYFHRFRPLLDFLKLPTLVITDLDSVYGPTQDRGTDGSTKSAALESDEQLVEQQDDTKAKSGACFVHTPGAVTSNSTLSKWLPGEKTIAKLLTATPAACTQEGSEAQALVRVVYQTAVEVEWKGKTQTLAGRTLEEAFALENLEWCQEPDRKAVKLHFRDAEDIALDELAKRLHNRVSNSSFKKTDFALSLLTQDPAGWNVPEYIENGLRWLTEQLTNDPPAKANPTHANEPILPPEDDLGPLAADGGEEPE